MALSHIEKPPKKIVERHVPQSAQKAKIVVLCARLYAPSKLLQVYSFFIMNERKKCDALIFTIPTTLLC